MNIKEAVQQVKENSKTKFDGTIEAHFNLTLDKKGDQSIRFTTVLPHGTGKTKKVAVIASKKIENADLELSENDIEKLEKGEIKPKVDFDVLISEPKFMPKLAKAARVLGPAGVMPNPKTGTVTDDVATAVEQVKKGRVEVKMEPNATNIHTIIGKSSFDNDKLVENYQEVLNSIKAHKPQKAKPDFIKSVFLAPTMGSSVQVDLE